MASMAAFSPSVFLLWAAAVLVPGTEAWAQERDCEPAELVQVVDNSPLCPGETLVLSATGAGDVLGYFWQGPNTPKFFTMEPWYYFHAPSAGTYMVVAYGPCGSDTLLLNISAAGAGAGKDSTLHLCGGSPPRELGEALGFHEEGGFWLHNGQPHSGTYTPGVDAPGVYQYTAPSPATCPGSTPCAAVTVEETAVGGSFFLEVCASDPAIDLLGVIGTATPIGGDWARFVFLGPVPHSGTYDPAVDSTGSFRYQLNGCQAFVFVAELPLLPWYTDVDEDGYGDPASLVLSCQKPSGTVSDSSDNCALLPGLVGDPCDDGLAATVDDVVTDSCTCTGLLPTALAAPQHTAPAFRIWPNPATGGSLYVRSELQGPAEIRLLDAGARLVCRFNVDLDRGAVHLDLPLPLAPGPYAVQLIAPRGQATVQLVVQ